MNALDIIAKKRDKLELTEREINFFVKNATNGEIADYQISAFLMAVYLNGMTSAETTTLAVAMAKSGERLNLSDFCKSGYTADKHSTGGVGDTTTLILVPLCAVCGLNVVKMSGRGLGFTGGTADKLMSIPGFRMDLGVGDIRRFIEKTGAVFLSQTENIAPADKLFYAIRDATATVESIPLIASSIMSKKIASGAKTLVLDVKCGNGAFMKDQEQAEALANEMLTIGKNAGLSVSAIITDMSEPLGNQIGCSLELMEAIDILKGYHIDSELCKISVLLGAHMLVLAEICESISDGEKNMLRAIKSGKGLKKLNEMIKNQYGDINITEDYSILPLSKESVSLLAEKDGFVGSIHAQLIGHSSVLLGAGRIKKEDSIDYGAGIVLHKRKGDIVKKGECLATFYAKNRELAENGRKLAEKAIIVTDKKPKATPFLLQTLI